MGACFDGAGRIPIFLLSTLKGTNNMKRFLALAVLTIATTLGTSNTAEAQWGRGGGRGYSISIGGGRGLGVSYSRGYGNFGRGYGNFGRGFGNPYYGYGGGFYSPRYRPVYVNRPFYGGGYYGGRVFYGGRNCGW